MIPKYIPTTLGQKPPTTAAEKSWMTMSEQEIAKEITKEITIRCNMVASEGVDLSDFVILLDYMAKAEKEMITLAKKENRKPIRLLLPSLKNLN